MARARDDIFRHMNRLHRQSLVAIGNSSEKFMSFLGIN